MTRQRTGLGIGILVMVAAVLAWRCRGGGDSTATSGTQPGSGAVKQAPIDRSTARSAPRPDPAAIQRATIAGTITRDDTKAPLAGARVCAHGESRDYADELLRDATCVATAADGTYLIEALLPAQYSVSASAKTFRPEQFHPDGKRKVKAFPVRAGEHRTGVDLALRAGGVEIVGTVSDLTGGPIAKARVVSDDPAVITETDDKGAFSLWVSKGQREVDASADGYAANSEYLFAPGKVEILLTPESSLSGTVVDAKSGKPVEAARVTLGDWSEAEAAFSDAQGKFRINRISPGRQTAVAKTDRGFGRAEGSTLVGLGQHVDGVIVKLFPAARVEARIMIAGDPKTVCERPRASLHDAAAQRWIQLRKEPDGLLWADGVLPGDYKPELGCDGYQPREKYDHVVIADADVTHIEWLVDTGAVIKGKIRTKSGEPVEDAEIWARTTTGAARAKTGWGGDESARDGTYELTGLKPGSYKIEVTSTKGVAPKDGFKVDVAAGATVEKDLVLDDVGTLTGLVIDANGAPVSSIDINTRILGGGRSWGGDHSSDDAGAFTIEGLRPGDYRVVAQRGWSDTLRKPGTTDDAKQGERVTIRANQVSTVKLVVEAQSGTIKGTVIDTDGSPVGDAFVSGARESDAAGAQRTNVQDTRWSWEDKPVLTSVDGKFTLDKLSPGTYTVRAFRKGGGEAIAEHIEVGATDAKLQIKSTGSIEGIATGPSGPPDELSISLNDPVTGIWRSEDYFKTNGRFTIRDLPKGHFRVTAESAGISARVELDLAEGEAKKGVTIKLEALLTLGGKVVDLATGKPVPGIHMSASMADGAGGSWFSSGDEENVTDEAGAFKIANAPKGRVMIRGMPKDWRDGEYAMLAVIRVVTPTGSTADVGSIPMVKKRVKQGDPVGELGVNWAEQPPETEIDKGEYKVSWIDPAGPAAKTDLKVGDVITSVDGIDIVGNQNTGAALLRAAPGTKLALGLARGVTVTVTLAAP